MTEVTADAVKAMRERTGLGLQQCKKILEQEALFDQLERATSIDDLKRIIRHLI